MLRDTTSILRETTSSECFKEGAQLRLVGFELIQSTTYKMESWAGNRRCGGECGGGSGLQGCGLSLTRLTGKYPAELLYLVRKLEEFRLAAVWLQGAHE